MHKKKDMMTTPTTPPKAQARLILVFAHQIRVKALAYLKEGRFVASLNLEEPVLLKAGYSAIKEDPTNCFEFEFKTNGELYLINSGEIGVLLGKFKHMNTTRRPLYFERVENFYLILLRESLKR